MKAQTRTQLPLLEILLFSGILVVFILWLIYVRSGSETMIAQIEHLPAMNALFNALSALCVLAGYWNIKRGRREIHMRFMKCAMLSSALFLVSYVVYHFFHGDTPFPGQGSVRLIYFSILITHIALSIVAVPMVLSTYYFAATGNFGRHRMLARITFPIWLYVSVTGVVIFLFLRSYT